MKDRFKSRKSLIEELSLARRRLAELKAGGASANGGVAGSVPGGHCFTETLINTLPGIFYLLDEQLRMVLWNRNLEKVSGYTHEEIASMSPLDLIAEDDRGLMAGMLREVARTGSVTAEARSLTRDGVEIPYFFTGTRLEDEGKVYFAGDRKSVV